MLVISGEENEGEVEVDSSRVLITTDGRVNAQVAIPHGTAVAQRYDSDVHVLNVVDLPAAGGAFNAGVLEKEFLERLDARGREAVDSVAKNRGICPRFNC